MNPIHPVKVTTFQLTAIVKGDIAVLLDRNGDKISSIRLANIGVPNPDAIEKQLWKHWSKTVQFSFFWSSFKRQRDPWARKADNLAASFRLRRRQTPYLGGMRRLDDFSTATWHDAALRMVTQAYNRFVRFDRSGWVRWSHTVSNNQNKRADAWRMKKT